MRSLDAVSGFVYQSCMKRAIVRNVALFGGLALSGALCVAALPYLNSPRGAAGPTILMADSPVAALVAVMLCLTLAALLCGIVARLTNSAVGMFVLGAGIFVLAGRMATVKEVAFFTDRGSESGTITVLALETLFWAILALVLTSIVFRLGGLLSDIKPLELERVPHPLFSAEGMKSAAAGALMLPLVAMIAKSNMTGQMLGATFLGGVAAGLTGRLISPNVQPILLFASPIFFGALGHLFALVLLKRPLDIAYVVDDLPVFTRPMPIDYAAGSLMGVAVGVGWARSFLHHEDEPAPVPASA